MRRAFWPNRDKSCSPEEYVREYGGRFGSDGRERPKARCPFCRQLMKLVGEDRGKRDVHFAHIGQQGVAPFCPVRNGGDHQYEFLRDAPADSTRGRLLRQRFFERWERHWQQFRRLQQHADVKEFARLIRKADETRLWHRADLAEWELPYIFLVWGDFPPVRTKDGRELRGDWLRFWFDSRVRTLDHLWIRTEGCPELIRASYDPPESGNPPKWEDVKNFEQIALDQDFLNARPPADQAVPDFVRMVMNGMFPSEVPRNA